MTQRLDYNRTAPGAVRPLMEAARYLRTSTTLESALLHLVDLRTSQINGCAFCIAMHWREGKEEGLTDDQLHGVAAWREASWYSERERAALAWTEAITRVAQARVPEELYEELRRVFSEKEIVDLTLAINTINSWNRFNAAFLTPPEKAAEVIEQLKALRA